MAAVSLAVVDRENVPIYLNEYPSKYHWKENEILDEELFGLSHLSEKDGKGEQFRSETDWDCGLKQQFILHTALDRFVQLAGPPPGYNWRSQGATGVDASFVGLLFPVECFRVYGYATTGKMKFICVVEDDEMVSDQRVVDDRIKALFAKIHTHYIEYTLNPFTKIDGPIESKTFFQKVDKDVEAFNRGGPFS